MSGRRNPGYERRGVVTVDTGLLTVALGLPTGSRIVAFEGPWRGSVKILVDHVDLPETADGEPYPDVDVVVNRTVGWRVAGLVPPEDEDSPRWPQPEGGS